MLVGLFSTMTRVARAMLSTVSLAVLLALILGTATVVLAAPAATFKLGVTNNSNATSGLRGTVNGGPNLDIANTGNGSALALHAAPGRPPLTVDAGAGVATNLDADKLDGKQATDFYAAGSKVADSAHADDAAHAAQADSAQHADAADQAQEAQHAAQADSAQNAQHADQADDANLLDGKDSTAFAGSGKSTYSSGTLLTPCTEEAVSNLTISPSRRALVYASASADYFANGSGLQGATLRLQLRNAADTATLASGAEMLGDGDGLGEHVPLAVQGVLMSGTDVYSSTAPFEVTPGNTYRLKLLAMSTDGPCGGDPLMLRIALSYMLIGE